jgi:hypothetical protein
MEGKEFEWTERRVKLLELLAGSETFGIFTDRRNGMVWKDIAAKYDRSATYCRDRFRACVRIIVQAEGIEWALKKLDD